MDILIIPKPADLDIYTTTTNINNLTTNAAMAPQTPLTFSGRPRESLPPRYPSSAGPSTSPKRPRAWTAGESLPQRKKKSAPPLKTTNAFLFRGLHPLYIRKVDEQQHDMMWIHCGQPGCKDFEPKLISRAMNSTCNHKGHYRRFHKEIPLSDKEVAALKHAKKQETLSFEKKPHQQTHDERFRVLLLEFVCKNNLSFRLVDQPETKALFEHLSPTTKQVSRWTLMKDLKARYERGESQIYNKLQAHIESGGRIALTTDAWSGNNKLDYTGVTAHWITKDYEQHSLLLDIIELTDAVHNGPYLAKKLLEVTDRFQITSSVISITRDNAAPNDVMLAEFEAEVANKYDLMEEADKAFYFLQYNRVEGDVRCTAHIYNLAVQAGESFSSPTVPS